MEDDAEGVVHDEAAEILPPGFAPQPGQKGFQGQIVAGDPLEAALRQDRHGDADHPAAQGLLEPGRGEAGFAARIFFRHGVRQQGIGGEAVAGMERHGFARGQNGEPAILGDEEDAGHRRAQGIAIALQPRQRGRQGLGLERQGRRSGDHESQAGLPLAHALAQRVRRRLRRDRGGSGGGLIGGGRLRPAGGRRQRLAEQARRAGNSELLGGPEIVLPAQFRLGEPAGGFFPLLLPEPSVGRPLASVLDGGDGDEQDRQDEEESPG